MERRDFLRTAGAATAGSALFAGGASAGEQETRSYPEPVDGTEVYDSKITTLRYPLAGVPAIVEGSDTLRVELDAESVSGVEAELVPSFGEADAPTDLGSGDVVGATESTIWPGKTYTVVEFELPGPSRDGAFTPDLYDLHVSWDGGSDHQPRAVSVRQEFPEEPKIAVIADPQIGDPRAVATGAEESGNKNSPDPLVTRTRRTTGDGSADSRWNATQTAIDEVNRIDADVVLIAGDLTFGQDAPGKYYAEYEEAWRVVNDIEAPTYTVLGNHDGYVQGGVDGKALYRETFSPLYYSVDIAEKLHIVGLDTYDWNYLDRQGQSVSVSTYGGQVRDEQFDWLESDLQNTDADSVLAFGHHNPSWQWDGDYAPANETEGTPIAEQAGRGTRFFTTGQGWTGQRTQFEIRDLFDEVGVSAYFSGHSHRDRISRTVPGTGPTSDIVETPGVQTPNDAQYHYVEYEDRDDDGRPEGQVNNEGRTQEDLAAMLRNDDLGTLYVNCTTTASSTGQYWGWRPLSIDTTNGEVTIDSDEFGYPATEEFLQDRAVNPGNWNPDHSEVGLYSHPSYLLDVETSDGGETATATVTNDLETPVSGAVVLSVDQCEGVVVGGGDRVWKRDGAGRSDVKVRYSVEPGVEQEITVTCNSST